jgi:hypothetical protein
MNIVVHTQFCENYNPDGPDMFWKFKGGEAYLIKNAPSPATAWAYVAIHHGFRSDMGIEVPTSWEFFNGSDEEFRNDYEFGIIDSGLAPGEAQRDPSPPAEGNLDAQASAEGDLRGIPPTDRRVDVTPFGSIWLVSGRVIHDDEDTPLFIEADSAQEAIESFKKFYTDDPQAIVEITTCECVTPANTYNKAAS